MNEEALDKGLQKTVNQYVENIEHVKAQTIMLKQ